ncbi:MAG: bifunctional adenosylcobinamide kinase/adenosylcobinamide-phosphate guanylyltransferase [Lachnospiraceae bacterium]|nr:bifunctional adenosylcobinamide kinase/adenosylcobinamide-phosphate guanylyltransferase [Lachnospiraceae bacterium]
MKMIIGGAFQGKHAFAERTCGIHEGWADGLSCTLEDIYTCRGIRHFHEYVKMLIREDRDPAAFVQELAEKNPDIVLVVNEIGYGVVPMDKFDRKYRETVGRICEQLAARSEEVYRVVCGIGTRIK